MAARAAAAIASAPRSPAVDELVARFHRIASRRDANLAHLIAARTALQALASRLVVAADPTAPRVAGIVEGDGRTGAAESMRGEGGPPSESATHRARALRSLRRRVTEHQAKLSAYRADPDAYDHLGTLRDAPTPEIRARIIEGRIRHLEQEIQTFQKQVDALMRDEDADGG